MLHSLDVNQKKEKMNTKSHSSHFIVTCHVLDKMVLIISHLQKMVHMLVSSNSHSSVKHLKVLYSEICMLLSYLKMIELAFLSTSL
jgi:hypothetical protein